MKFQVEKPVIFTEDTLSCVKEWGGGNGGVKDYFADYLTLAQFILTCGLGPLGVEQPFHKGPVKYPAFQI